MAQGGQLHPHGHWVGGQAMHRIQELGMGRAWSQQAGSREETRKQRGEIERTGRVATYTLGTGKAAATMPGVS